MEERWVVNEISPTRCSEHVDAARKDLENASDRPLVAAEDM